jgi:hypothetical protein
MKRLATILVIALTATALAASSALAAAPKHSGEPHKDRNETPAMIALAVVGALLAGSALVPFERRRRPAKQPQGASRPAPARG